MEGRGLTTNITMTTNKSLGVGNNDICVKSRKYIKYNNLQPGFFLNNTPIELLFHIYKCIINVASLLIYSYAQKETILTVSKCRMAYFRRLITQNNTEISE